MKNELKSDLMSVAEYARLCGFKAPARVYQLIKDGKVIPTVLAGTKFISLTENPVDKIKKRRKA